MHCKPKSSRETRRVINLTRWIEKTESIYQISFCPEDCKLRFAACTFVDAALTWWNNHVNAMGINTTNSMKWEELKTMKVEEYCLREEIQKMEEELWNLTMEDSAINAYTARFNDLAVMCLALETLEYKKIERYIWGLVPQVKGMVIASNPTTIDSTKRIAYQLTNTKNLVGFISESPESRVNKRKFNGKNPKQSSEKRQDVITNYAATTTIPLQPRKYAGKFPGCTQFKRHQLGNCSWCSQCTISMQGHAASYYRSTTPITVKQGSNTGTCYDGGRACFECGEIGHIKKECPKLISQ
uniref:CCHC-type domain-containing protein n=1 Tax=Lactuca sativa TaxID=4236 RepID=A0A9R1VW51_LACSA|nr:hypothetical protein LSAT_V11C400208970 [Lactuca sativa]